MQDKTFSIKKASNGKYQIWDCIRNKYVILTPEEKVRQAAVLYLMENLKVPKSCILLEHLCLFNKKKFRADIAICNKKGKIVWIIECKREEIDFLNSPSAMSQTLDQAMQYSLKHDLEYISIYNGKDFYIWKKYLEGDFVWKPYCCLPYWEEFV